MTYDANNIRTVAVTGASGFCGAAVARAVAARGFNVVGVGRRPGPVGVHRMWDASTEASPDLSGIDAVIHLAAAVGDHGSRAAHRRYERVNIDGAHRLLSVAGDRRVVWVSSSSVYDPRLDRSNVSETHPTVGGHLNVYGRTKAVGDRAAEAAGAVVIRPRAVYGPGDRVLLPRLVSALREPRPGRGGRHGGTAVLPLPGPDVRLSLCHVENLAGACIAGLAWPAGAYNVADATPYSRDSALGSVLGAATGRPVRVIHVPLVVARLVASVNALPIFADYDRRITPYSVDQLSHDFVLDTTRAKSTGWTPEHTLDAYIASFADPGGPAKHFDAGSA